LELTNPTTIPDEDDDPVYYPPPIVTVSNGSAIVAAAISQIQGIIAETSSSNCSKCIAALKVGQYVAQRVPQMVPAAMVALCEMTHFASNTTCRVNYEATTFGAVWTQILALGDMGGLDGQYACHSLSSAFCPAPYTLPSNTTGLFPKPKPEDAQAPAASGTRVKVLHLSDFHLDPRYDVGQEANCSSGLCCRPSGSGTASEITIPAPLYGAYACDTPYFLATAALQAVGPLTGTTSQSCSQDDSFAWTVYTGDLVSHDSQNQLSRNYTEYAEYAVYYMLKHYIPGGPIFPVLGNHDSNPEAIDSPHSLPGALSQQQSWNYDHVSALWQQNNWISPEAAAQARMHYAAYSINHPQYPKLRIITLNTDFWYRSNFLNFINTTNPDNSGSLAFLVQELQAAEDAGERVWILGHVLTGWDGSNPMPNPTDLFYQIVDRYSPHVIANIFFGHTHEDEFMIYYANNGTSQTDENALAVGWIGPSVTPLTNVNSGFRMYEVDTGDFSVYEAYTYYADVSSFSTLNTSVTGPVFELEYSTREAYQIGWPADAPLNATYWHRVTEAMLANHSMVSLFNTYEGKSSVKSPNCTNTACAQAKVCYMRSGSVALGTQCPQG
jgi:Calcineurin-like phosphoesterase